jgi:hypothetical protein
MNTALFLDLDDTLFQTTRKCPDGVALVAGARNKAGAVHSFMTPQQAELWQRILASGVQVVPVTARSAAALGRVELPLQARYASVDFGATLLVDGNPDPEWQARAEAICAASKARLTPLWQQAQQYRELSLEWVTSSAGGLYLTARDYGQQPQAMQALRRTWGAWVAEHGDFFLHDNHTLALVPKAFDKSHAVAQVQRRLRADGPLLSLGLADSASDLGFLRLCDFIGLPGHSQLAQRL